MKRREFVALLGGAAAFSAAWPLAAGAVDQVDLLLVLAMDVSRSMDQPKFLLQRRGYAAAISDPHVLEAITSGPHQKIAVCFMDWSGVAEQRLVIDWSLIDGETTAREFGNLILQAPRSFFGSTSIGGGIAFAAAQFARAPFRAERETIDVSGDGTNNAGVDVRLARDQAIAKGITINGLVILTDVRYSRIPWHTNPPGGLEQYYRDNVIGGPASFVSVAENFDSFGRSMVQKLVAEIAASPAQQRSASTGRYIPGP